MAGVTPTVAALGRNPGTVLIRADASAAVSTCCPMRCDDATAVIGAIVAPRRFAKLSMRVTFVASARFTPRAYA